MRKLLGGLFIMLAFSVGSQISFYKSYTGSPFDEGQGITQLPDSSYAITGSSAAFYYASSQAYLMLIDSLGNHLWTKSYGGDGSDWGRRVFHIPGQGFMIAGYTNSTADGSFDAYLIKTDENGSLVWEKNFGTSDWERIWDATLLSDGGVIVVGESEGDLSDMKDMYIARTDGYGDTVWTRKISTPYDDVAYTVAQMNDTTILVGGDSFENGEPRGTIISMHINGNINWQNYYGDTVETGLRDLVFYNNKIYGGGYVVQMGNTDRDFWLLKADDSGIFENQNTTHYNGDDILNAIAIPEDDKLYIGLISDSPDLNVYGGGYDMFVLRFHTFMYFNGMSQGYSGYDPDIIHEMISTNDNAVAFVATVSDDRQVASYGSDVVVVKIGPNDEVTTTVDDGNDLVAISEQSVDKTFHIFPNPASTHIFIPEGLHGEKFEIYGSEGKRVESGILSSKLVLNDLSQGFYTLRVLKENAVINLRFVKK
ncbi:MAG: T9SS type A sorting domain-containing protein [Brumimicrobium sp.]|nr:T9SS type A sorting domain-containing protein [Brumimicrobium sp.]